MLHPIPLASKQEKPPRAKARRKKGGAAGETNGASPGPRPPAPSPEPSSLEHLDPERVDPSPYQPRLDFPQGEIVELAESIVANGLIHPITVRPKGKRYELIDGERRLRAAKLAKSDGRLETIRAEVQDRTDAECRAAVLVTAIARKELSPIEEARAFAAAIAAGDAAGPTELARQYGLSQGHVSNRLRLLKLPATLQERIISREMPATHARTVAVYAEQPAAMRLVADEVEEMLDDEFLPGARQFADSLRWCISRATEPMEGDRYEMRLGRRLPFFRPTAEEEAKLGIVEIPAAEGEGTERRATNVKLWEKLRAKQIEELLAKGENGKKKAGSRGGGEEGRKKKAATAEEKKAAAEAEKRKRAEQARRYREWLVGFATDWRRYLIARSIRGGCLVLEDMVRLLLVAGVQWLRYDSDCRERLGEALKAAGASVKRVYSGYRVTLAPTLEVGDVDAVARDVLAGLLCSAEGVPTGIVPTEDVWTLCEWLDVNPDRAWLEEQAGPLSEAYWQRQTTEQLRRQAETLGVEAPAGAKKKDLVAAFLGRIPGAEDKEVGIDLPAELKKVKRPKG